MKLKLKVKDVTVTININDKKLVDDFKIKYYIRELIENVQNHIDKGNPVSQN